MIVVCRGGGSLEDLWAFNELPVAEAIRDARVPVVTGVGHETDVTLADLVADQRAHTPTDAAQTVIPDRARSLEELERAANHLAQAIDGALGARASASRARGVAVAARRGLDPRPARATALATRTLAARAPRRAARARRARGSRARRRGSRGTSPALRLERARRRASRALAPRLARADRDAARTRQRRVDARRALAGRDLAAPRARARLLDHASRGRDGRRSRARTGLARAKRIETRARRGLRSCPRSNRPTGRRDARHPRAAGLRCRRARATRARSPSSPTGTAASRTSPACARCSRRGSRRATSCSSTTARPTARRHAVERGFPGIVAAPQRARTSASARPRTRARETALARGADAVFFVNNDVELPAGTLARLARELDAIPTLGIVGPRVLYKRRAGARVVRGRDADVAREPLDAARPPRARRAALARDARASTTSPAARCSPGARCSSSIGLFDAQYFAYMEDVDLCLRAHEAGFGVRLVGDAAAYHATSSATGGGYNPRRKYMMGVNSIWFLRRHARARAVGAVLRVRRAHAAVPVARRPVPRPREGRGRRRRLGIFDGLRGKRVTSASIQEGAGWLW